MDPESSGEFFALLSRRLSAEPEETTTLQTVAEKAVEVVPACDYCAVSSRRRRSHVETVASTSDVANQSDALQYALDEGPCLDAISEQESFLVEDVLHEKRWPRWSAGAAKLGIGSILSVRLFTDEEVLGALNLYAAKPHGYDQENIDIALLFAVHAATAISSARLVSGLQTALQSRHMIGVAQGVLMERYGLSLDRSFEVLRRFSSHTNTKLRDVANQVVADGVLPEVGGPQSNGSLPAAGLPTPT
ncbi:MAG TPA: GAF and ANTAR domain-containing protein [Nocardioidaceae bacterium]|nr:GAF and ANTAR domain-containing protein [Nocardioidaceae bacterium]